MRISDWSSDVCSSDLLAEKLGRVGHVEIELCGAKIAGPGIQDIVVDSIGLAIAVGDVTRADIAAEIDELVSVVIADRIVAADIHVEETARKKGSRPVAHQVGREGAGRKVTPRPAIGTEQI